MAPEFGKPIHQLPLIPANVLKKHRVHEPLDPRFRSAARLLQALRREAAYREIGALIDAERLATNLLSSMPLTFNLLAPWGHAPERASNYLIEVLPAFTGSARQLLFEHSPGRGNPKFTGDYTAFDALIRYSDGQGRNGFVAFEIKSPVHKVLWRFALARNASPGQYQAEIGGYPGNVS
jgi:hypothetical protein